MEQTNSPKKQLFFDETFLKVSSDVLQKYKLDESPEELIEKMKTDKQLYCEIFMDIVRNLFGKSIKENELVPLLESKLSISKEIAEKLGIDIKEKILPLIKEVETPTEEQKEETRENIQTEKDDELSFIKKTPIISVEENEKVLKKEREPIITKKPIDTEEIKKPVKKKDGSSLEKAKESTPQSKQPKGPDSYREPIG